MCYKACIDGFMAACRPLLFLDGTFLKDWYTVTLIRTTTYDGNNRLFSLVFCMCNIEDTPNWMWFQEHLCRVLYGRTDTYQPPYQLVMISNGEEDIKDAFAREQKLWTTRRSLLHLRLCLPYLFAMSFLDLYFFNYERLGNFVN